MSETGPLTESDIDAILAMDTGCCGLIVAEAATVEELFDQLCEIGRAINSEPQNEQTELCLLCWL